MGLVVERGCAWVVVYVGNRVAHKHDADDSVTIPRLSTTVVEGTWGLRG